MTKVNEEVLKRAVIAGASRALRFQEENPMLNEDEVLKQVVEDLESITREIDKE